MTTRLAAALVLSLVLHAGKFVAARPNRDTLLEECENEGRKAGASASYGACAGLLNECPIPRTTGLLSWPAQGAPVDVELEETCDTRFVEACKRAGVAEVFNTNFRPEGCTLILAYGPHPGVVDCPDRYTAVSIFSDLLTEICETNMFP